MRVCGTQKKSENEAAGKKETCKETAQRQPKKQKKKKKEEKLEKSADCQAKMANYGTPEMRDKSPFT